jgi:glycerate kinase
MQVLVAPAAFKGTLSPAAVAESIKQGILEAAGEQSISIVCLPLADGGDGTVASVHAAIGGKLVQEQVLDALSNPTHAVWLKRNEYALVELAEACGIGKLSAAKVPLKPMQAHTYGLGQLIARAYEAGCSTIDVAVGGSASTDGGMGALKALGAAFLGPNGTEIEQLGGAALAAIRSVDLIDVRAFAKYTKLRVLTDVGSPLLGPQGAAFVFAPQKGADDEQVKLLDSALENFANVLESASGKQCRQLPGTGAAGGTAFGLATALSAEIVGGFECVADLVGLSQRIDNSDLVITGEGCLDQQSLLGKVPGRISSLCKDKGKPLWVVAGRTEEPVLSRDIEKLVVAAPSNGGYCSGADIAAEVCRQFGAWMATQFR